MRRYLRRAWGHIEGLADGSAAAPALFGIALLDFAIVAAAFPLAEGRDLGTYLRASHELLSPDVVLPQALLMRAPVTGLVAGGLLSAGPVAVEAAMAVLYAASVVCWWCVARRLGTGPGVIFAVVLLLYPSFGLLFHRLSSDALYAAAFSVSALLVARMIERPSAGRAAALGGAFALLVLIRPVSQSLILLAPLFLLCPGSWLHRFGRLAAFAVAAVLSLLAWAGHNAVRADDFTVVRGGGQSVPLFRAFVVDGIVRPDNGPASRELARVVARDLLPREPYRSYGVDVDEFFASRSARMHEDLIGLSDRTWGWDDDYGHLARVGREAVLSHPVDYAKGVGRDFWRLLWWPLFLPLDQKEKSGASQSGAERNVDVNATGLPTPSEGQLIPSASISAWISTPDGSIQEVWTTPIDHTIVFRNPAAEAHVRRLESRLNKLAAKFPDRDSSPSLGKRLNQASRWFPRSIVWLVVGLVAVLFRRPRGLVTPVVIVAAALVVLVGTSLAVPATAEYSIPMGPAFVLLAVCGLLGPSSARPPRRVDR